MKKRSGVTIFSSVFILAKRTLPSYSRATASNVGAISTQGRHQGAQKSTTTGSDDCSTSCPKLRSVTSVYASDIQILLGQMPPAWTACAGPRTPPTLRGYRIYDSTPDRRGSSARSVAVAGRQVASGNGRCYHQAIIRPSFP